MQGRHTWAAIAPLSFLWLTGVVPGELEFVEASSLILTLSRHLLLTAGKEGISRERDHGAGNFQVKK